MVADRYRKIQRVISSDNFIMVRGPDKIYEKENKEE